MTEAKVKNEITPSPYNFDEMSGALEYAPSDQVGSRTERAFGKIKPRFPLKVNYQNLLYIFEWYVDKQKRKTTKFVPLSDQTISLLNQNAIDQFGYNANDSDDLINFYIARLKKIKRRQSSMLDIIPIKLIQLIFADFTARSKE
jgi:hypothetical protein